MNTSGSNNTQSRIDFSRPPPGYPIQGASSSKKYESPSHGSNRPDDYLVKIKNDRGTESVNTNETKYSYYQGLNVSSVFQAPTARPSSRERPEASTYRAVPPPTPPDPPVGMDPRLFSVPPPPPPPDPYPTNIPVPYICSTVYCIPVPQPGMPQMGAGQYMTQQPGNFQLPQYQGEYSGYSKRGGFNNHLNRKRHMPLEYESEGSKRSSKKKKKPLSQNMPSKKDWSVEDAKRAMDAEREFNKRSKCPSLIIKFPDLDVNRDIVSKFHTEIESVHFQQPSTPRFCFVTLKESACMDDVIRDINKVKFGTGYLTAEPKNNKEDDMVKGPEDIDPLTLYVGNLAQEVTVDDVVKAYPKHKRIDIGFAKKMKYTRYAFVSFRTVDDAIAAFQDTHATEMYSKSIIVRFRRLHGTVGLPGDSKQQNPHKKKASESTDKCLHLKLTDKSIKREPPENDSFGGHSSDEYEGYGEDQEYAANLKSLLYSDETDRRSIYSRRYLSMVNRDELSLEESRGVHVKNEPVDYDSESDFPLTQRQSSEENLHIPLVEVKTESDVKPLVNIKQEKEDLDAKVKEEPQENGRNSRERRNSNSDDGELDHFEDPFLSEL